MTPEKREANERQYAAEANNIIRHFCTHNNAKGINGIAFLPQGPCASGYDLDKLYIVIEPRYYEDLIERTRKYGKETGLYDESFVKEYEKYIQDVFFNYGMDNGIHIEFDTSVNVLPPNKYFYKKQVENQRQEQNNNCWLVNEVNKKIAYNRRFER